MVRGLTVLLGLPLVVRLAGTLGLGDGWLTTPVLGALPWAAAGAFLLAGFVLLAAAARRRPPSPVLLVPVVLAVAHGLVLTPRVLPADQPDAGGPRLTVGLVNVRVGGADADAVAGLVAEEGVDVLVVLELTEGFATALAATSVAADLPQQVLAPGGSAAGGSVHARVPLEPLRPVAPGGDTPDVLLDVDGTQVELVTTHPFPPVGPRLTALWREGLGRIEPPVDGRAALLVGDLNATLDHRALRDVLDLGWRDAAAEVGGGLAATFDGILGGSIGLPMTLDHVLVGPGIAVEDVVVHRVAGSDHRLVVASLVLPD